MSDIEKDIRGTERCTVGPECDSCPWSLLNKIGFAGCRADAIARLKKLLPRVMTLDELQEWDGTFLIETRITGATVWASWYAEYTHYGATMCRMVDIGGEVDDRFKNMYGSEWRCWTSRPTDEQMEAVKWNEDTAV